MFGKQTVYCANCGQRQWIKHMNHNHVKSMLCSGQCLKEWELKYARMILGKDGLADEPLPAPPQEDQRND